MRNSTKAVATATALLLASASNATTFITYTGTGHGSFTAFDYNHNTIGQGGASFTYSMTILADPSWIGCLGPMQCSVSSSGINATYLFGSTGWETLSLAFTNSGNTQYPDINSILAGGHAFSSSQGQYYSVTYWDGVVDTVQISTFDDDFTMTNFGINWFGSGVPEPATWALMIAGFAAAGASMRRRKPKGVYA